MKQSVINFKKKLALFTDKWSPRVIAEMNDYQFKLVRLEGDFIFHCHENTDETFIVLAGDLSIEFESGVEHLSAGEMLVVPRGVMHRPRAKGECQVLLVEPRDVINTGDAGGELTAPSNQYL